MRPRGTSKSEHESGPGSFASVGEVCAPPCAGNEGLVRNRLAWLHGRAQRLRRNRPRRRDRRPSLALLAAQADRARPGARAGALPRRGRGDSPLADARTIRDGRSGSASSRSIVILFDGGMHIGWRRFRARARPDRRRSASSGTFDHAPAITPASRTALLGFGWTTAGLLGAALAPTDPAVMFSVLGGSEIGGRTGTILEGESGANDPVGIALMIGMIELATARRRLARSVVGREFALEMAVGLAVGLAGGRLLRPAACAACALPSEGLYPLRTLAAARRHLRRRRRSRTAPASSRSSSPAWSLGDARRRRTSARSSASTRALASLAEIVVFVALGLTVERRAASCDNGVWLDGLVLAAVARVRRPPARRLAPLLAPAPAALRREALHRLGRPQGRGADPARRLRDPRRASTTRGGSTGSCSSSSRSRSSSRARLPFVAKRLGVRMRVGTMSALALLLAVAAAPTPARARTSRTGRSRTRATAAC